MPIWLITSLVAGGLGFFGPKLIGGGYVKKYTKCVEQKTRQEQKIIKSEQKKCKKSMDKKQKKIKKKLASCTKKSNKFLKERTKWEKEKKKLKITKWGRLDKDKVGKQLVACEKESEKYETLAEKSLEAFAVSVSARSLAIRKSSYCLFGVCLYRDKTLQDKYEHYKKELSK